MDWSALVSAFLGGSLGTLITGWFDRRARRRERDDDFQRDTLKELLDALEALSWDVQAVEAWRREPEFHQMAMEQERASLPEPERAQYVGKPFDEVAHTVLLASEGGVLERMTKSRLHMEKLANQVKDEQVRTQCYRLSVVARETRDRPASDRAGDIIGPLSERVGALLRGETGIMLDLGSTPDEPAHNVSQRLLL